MDSKGNVYYTDLAHVWKITPAGKKSIAVRAVHTHELYIDANDNLYGEHLWYEGERTDKWGHRVWKLSQDGKLTDIIASREGFREDYGDFAFVQDRHGSMYWAERGDTTLIHKRMADGSRSVVAKACFDDVRWMTVTPDGTIYLIDLYDLIRINNDSQMHVLVENLPGWSLKRVFGPDRHAVMGLWTDRQNNVYAAIHADRVVKKISTNGKAEIIARSYFPWSPTGGLIASNGDLWILESSFTNAVRVRRIDKNGTSTVFE